MPELSQPLITLQDDFYLFSSNYPLELFPYSSSFYNRIVRSNYKHFWSTIKHQAFKLNFVQKKTGIGRHKRLAVKVSPHSIDFCQNCGRKCSKDEKAGFGICKFEESGECTTCAIETCTNIC